MNSKEMHEKIVEIDSEIMEFPINVLNFLIEVVKYPHKCASQSFNPPEMHWNAQIYWEINQIYQETTNHEEEEKLDWETNFSKSAKLQLTFLQFRSGHKTQAAEKMSRRDSCGSQFFATDIKTQVEMFMCQQTLWPDIYLAVGIKVT